MISQDGYRCQRCGELHDGPPLAYGLAAPVYWHDGLGADESSELVEEQCVIEGKHLFVRARLLIPVVDAGTDFEWGVWTSLSEASFVRIGELWTSAGRESEPPYFGYLSNELPAYPVSTLNLKCNVHTRPVGERPTLELEPTDHPLAVEQRTGITLDRVREIAELVLHP